MGTALMGIPKIAANQFQRLSTRKLNSLEVDLDIHFSPSHNKELRNPCTEFNIQMQAVQSAPKTQAFKDKEKPAEVRANNILAAKCKHIKFHYFYEQLMDCFR